jgi:hypothetical protein
MVFFFSGSRTKFISTFSLSYSWGGLAIELKTWFNSGQRFFYLPPHPDQFWDSSHLVPTRFLGHEVSEVWGYLVSVI